MTGTGADIVVHNWLAVLLPLTLPQVDGAAIDPLTRVRNLAGKLDEPLRHLVDVAAQGEKTVQRNLHQLIDEASRGLEDQDV